MNHCSLIARRRGHVSQRLAARIVCGAGRAGVPFSVPQADWSAGRRQGSGETPYGPCEGPLCASRQDGPLSRFCRFGTRGPSDAGPSASRRSTATAICGRRTRSTLVRLATTPSDQQGEITLGSYRKIVKIPRKKSLKPRRRYCTSQTQYYELCSGLESSEAPPGAAETSHAL